MIFLNALATVRGGSAPEARWVALIFVVALVLLFLGISVAAARSLRRAAFRRREPAAVARELDWKRLVKVARGVIEQTISRLPPPLQKEADELGWTWEKWSGDFGAEALGQFWGASRAAPVSGGARIVLYMGDLSEYCALYGCSFEEEVRITYLHELGHYLGFDESELEERGLK